MTIVFVPISTATNSESASDEMLSGQIDNTKEERMMEQDTSQIYAIVLKYMMYTNLSYILFQFSKTACISNLP